MRPYVKLLWQLVFRLLLRILALQQLQDSVVRPMRCAAERQNCGHSRRVCQQ